MLKSTLTALTAGTSSIQEAAAFEQQHSGPYVVRNLHENKITK